MKFIKIISLLNILLLLSACPLGDKKNQSSTPSPVCGYNDSSCSSNDPITGNSDFSITESMPKNGEKNVYNEGPYAMYFGESIASYSIVHNSVLPGQKNSVILKNTLTGEEVLIDVRVFDNELLVTPYLPLEGSTEYSLEVTTDLKSVSGQNLDKGNKVFFETKKTHGSSIAGKSVVNWEMEHDKQIPISHFILFYGANNAEMMDSAGNKIVDPQHEWQNERVVRPASLNPDLEGKRAYHAEFNNDDLPGLIPGTYNYFTMKACNGEVCSDYANQTDKYID